ncbi:MAG: carbon-nitrogen hydrolase family protein, partial [Actinomycetia bacterium]|nr:carbon-nitrogen hydrolase family protein [Actinomycetes bacterium]
QGEIIAKYRKIHLFEINFQNNTNYDESDFLSPGNELSYNNILGIKAGMTICYDLRFPEIFRALTSIGCKIIFVPSSFEEETGKSHWETLLRTRAIENQVYIVAPNQTGFTKNTLTKKWGHSLIINPWGEILCTIEKGEGCASAVIDIKFLEKVRKKVPVLKYLKKHGSI